MLLSVAVNHPDPVRLPGIQGFGVAFRLGNAVFIINAPKAPSSNGPEADPTRPFQSRELLTVLAEQAVCSPCVARDQARVKSIRLKGDAVSLQLERVKWRRLVLRNILYMLWLVLAAIFPVPLFICFQRLI